ncbi:metal ABC transporter permease [Actinomyces sp. Marseille-QA0893]
MKLSAGFTVFNAIAHALPLWQSPFFLRPLLFLLFFGIAAGVVGTLVNLRNWQFGAEASVHSIFPGIVVGAVFGGIDWIPAGGGICAIFVAAALTWAMRHRAHEAAAAVVLTSFFALGVIISLKKGDMSGQMEALMFGRLLEVTPQRMVISLVFCLFACVLVLLSWRAQLMCAFDSAGAGAARVPTTLCDVCLNASMCAIVVAGASAIGVLLVVGYLIVPALAARLLSSSPRQMLAYSVVLSCAGGALGMVTLLIPLSRPTSPQASVALTQVALCALIVGLHRARKRVTTC